MSILRKVTAIAGTVGAIGTGAASFSYFNSEDKSLTARLKKVGYQILKDEGEEWQKLLDAYKSIDNKAKELLILNNKEELKSKCQEILKKNDDTKYKLARKWCVKEETMQQMLKRNGYTPINLTIEGEKKDKLEAKVAFLKAKNERGWKMEGDSKPEIEILQKACEEFDINNTKTHSNDDFEDKFNKASRWCSEGPKK